MEKIKSLIDKGGVVGSVLLDLIKAFGNVNHKVVFSKLATFNPSEGTLKWM